jgi:phosphoglycolate phosphatase
MPQLPLVLFDIDGTILRSGNRIHGQSVRVACEKFFGVAADTPIPAEVDLAGRTDRHIITALLAAHGIPAAEVAPRLPEVFAFMDEYVARELTTLTEYLLPGVAALLDELARRDRALGLVTGNLPRIAEAKLAAAGVWEPFARYEEVIGGFGDASTERNDLPPLALTAAGRILGTPPNPADAIIIGDTPHDIVCARVNGLRAIAVTTGRYNAEQLRTHEPDLLLPDLSDHERVLAFIG